MLKVYADFNSRSRDDACWLLKYQDRDLAEQVRDLGLTNGDKVVLYQDLDDFEVEGILDFRHVEGLGRSTWVVVPDWSTLVDV